MSKPIIFCMIRKALDTNNWKKYDDAMIYNFGCKGYTQMGCMCGKCKPLTKEEDKLFNDHYNKLRKRYLKEEKKLDEETTKGDDDWSHNIIFKDKIIRERILNKSKGGKRRK